MYSYIASYANSYIQPVFSYYFIMQLERIQWFCNDNKTDCSLDLKLYTV